jgi:signal transduction histidine kinase
VSALGGTLEIDSPVGAGTTIRARMPLIPPGEASGGAGGDAEYAHA